MSLPALLEPEAANELEDAVVWYERQHRGLGVDFLAAVDQAIAHLVQWPDVGVQVPGMSEGTVVVRRVPVPRFPYHVVYLITPEAIRVLAFAHDRRRPGYWQRRSR